MKNYLSNTWIQSRSVTSKLTLSKRPGVNQVAEKAQGLPVIVVLVVIVVQSTLPRSVKLLEKKCYGCGKLNHFVTMCRSRNRSQSQSKGTPHSTNKPSGTKQNEQHRSCRDF